MYVLAYVGLVLVVAGMPLGLPSAPPPWRRRKRS